MQESRHAEIIKTYQILEFDTTLSNCKVVIFLDGEGCATQAQSEKVRKNASN